MRMRICLIAALCLLSLPAAAQQLYGSVPASSVTGVLPLANGGTAAALTASNGGILYSTASALAIASPITGLVLGAGAASPGAYGGTSCTNQFPRSLDLNGAATCASVANGDLAGSIASSKLLARANSQAQPSSPTAPNSTSVYKMQGLAGTITPTFSGNVLIIITGTCKSSTVTAGDGILVQISYGTSTAPTSNAALTGTQVGPIIQYDNDNTVVVADTFIPFTASAVVTGLSLSTAYWVDLAAKSVATASSIGLVNVGISIVEI